jgi:hypothetical protein
MKRKGPGAGTINRDGECFELDKKREKRTRQSKKNSVSPTFVEQTTFLKAKPFTDCSTSLVELIAH